MRIFLLQAEKKFNCNVETKLICEYRLPCRLFFLLRFFIFFFCQNKEGLGPPRAPPLDPSLLFTQSQLTKLQLHKTRQDFKLLRHVFTLATFFLMQYF